MSFKQENVTGTRSTAHTIICMVSMVRGRGLQLEKRRSKLRRRAVDLATHINN
jgi:hypothetical protein